MRHQQLERIAGRLLIQCRPGQAPMAAEVARLHDTGLVITGSDATAAAHLLRDRGFTGPVLCDADRYSGRRRSYGGAGMRDGWCRRQSELGLLPLTDSGHLEAADLTGLRAVLAHAEEHGAVATLPLAAAWFKDDGALGDLIGLIAEQGVPVAVAIEHRADPFGARYVVQGFLRLLRESGAPVVLLRSDASAIGALCHGARAAAVGTASGLRHTYPRTTGGAPPVPGVSAFVPALLGFHLLDTVGEVAAATPDLSQLWDCDCAVCAGRALASLTDAPASAAARHSLHSLLDVWAGLMAADTPTARQLSWHEHCSHAMSIHDDVAKAITAWRHPLALRHWIELTQGPAPIPWQSTETEGPRPTRPSELPAAESDRRYPS